MLRAVVYTRVSSKEQVENLSLETQERACHEWCRSRDVEVARTFVERGESAKTSERPEFQALLQYCQVNKRVIDLLVVYSLSRFARNDYDHHVVRTLLAKYGIQLRSVTEPIDESPSGRLMEGVLASFAQFDNDLRSERTKVGMRASAERGRWQFRPPIGYAKPELRDGPSLVPHPKAARLVRLAFEDYATGRYSKEDVRARVNALGLRSPDGKPLSPQSFDNLLRNPAYTGRVVIPSWKLSHNGDFEALISEETFAAVQAVLSGRRVAPVDRQQDHPDFPLRRFIRCGSCDRPLTGAWSSGKRRRYAYYRCPDGKCGGVKIRRERLEALFVDLLEALEPRPAYLRLFRRVVFDIWEDRHREVRERTEALAARQAEIETQQRKLRDAYIYRGAISDQVWEEESDHLAHELARVRLEIGEARIEELDVEAILNYAEYVLGNAGRLWRSLESSRKRRVQETLLPKGVTFDGKAFGTPETCLAFGELPPIQASDSRMVSPEGFEPPSQD